MPKHANQTPLCIRCFRTVKRKRRSSKLLRVCPDVKTQHNTTCIGFITMHETFMFHGGNFQNKVKSLIVHCAPPPSQNMTIQCLTKESSNMMNRFWLCCYNALSFETANLDGHSANSEGFRNATSKKERGEKVRRKMRKRC